MNLLVLSTGFRSDNALLCKTSVARQTGLEAMGVTWSHTYIEASEQRPRKTKLENLHDAIAPLAPETVVALVDGDDHLAHRGALARVMREHAMGHWVTYGSFVQSDGKPGFAAPYLTTDYRAQQWLGTHLKTFRAGLFQRIRREDLMYRGQWIDRGDDPAFMFCCLEQAGPDRVKFIDEVLYVYSHSESWELGATPDERQHERDIVADVRSRQPYARLESL